MTAPAPRYPMALSSMGEAEGERIGPDHAELANRQGMQALAWLDDARKGAGIPWASRTLHQAIGRLMPGWMVAIGARPGCGKTTLALTQALAWAESGRRVAIVGTETNPDALRVQLAALRLGLPVGTALKGDLPDEDHDRLTKEIIRQTGVQEWVDGLLVADRQASRTVEDVLYWLDWGADHGAEVVIFDHLQELSTAGKANRFTAMDDAVHRLGDGAVERGVVLVVLAQFNRGRQGDDLALHEVPNESLWRDTDAIQQKSVVALQLWKPFAQGVTAEMKTAYRHQTPHGLRQVVPTLDSLLAFETMGVRIAKHRYFPPANGMLLKLHVRGDHVGDFVEESPDQPERYR